MKLHHQIFLAMLIGAALGAITQEQSTLLGVPVLASYDLVGTLFINALKMVVVPLIVTAIISGMVGVGGGKNLGRMGMKTVGLYMMTTLVAVLTGLLLVNLFTPGIIDGEPAKDLLGLARDTGTVLEKIEGRGAGDFTAILLQMLPPNLVQAAANGQMLGLIVFALLFGFYLRTEEGPAGESLRNMIDGIYQVVMRITMLIIRFTPLGVMALIAATVTRTGLDAIEPLAWFFLCAVIALAVHAFVFMPALILLMARRSPLRHLQAMTPALLTAFSPATDHGVRAKTLGSITPNQQLCASPRSHRKHGRYSTLRMRRSHVHCPGIRPRAVHGNPVHDRDNSPADVNWRGQHSRSLSGCHHGHSWGYWPASGSHRTYTGDRQGAGHVPHGGKRLGRQRGNHTVGPQ